MSDGDANDCINARIELRAHLLDVTGVASGHPQECVHVCVVRITMRFCHRCELADALGHQQHISSPLGTMINENP